MATGNALQSGMIAQKTPCGGIVAAAEQSQTCIAPAEQPPLLHLPG